MDLMPSGEYSSRRSASFFAAYLPETAMRRCPIANASRTNALKIVPASPGKTAARHETARPLSPIASQMSAPS